MLTKQQWIEGVLEIAERIVPVSAPEGFEEKILLKTANKLELIKPNKTIQWSIAAGVLLLIALNILCIGFYHNSLKESVTIQSKIDSKSFANTYFSYLNDI